MKLGVNWDLMAIVRQQYGAVAILISIQTADSASMLMSLQKLFACGQQRRTAYTKALSFN